MRIGIVGYGTVGRAMERFFRSSPQNDIVLFDKYLPHLSTDAARVAINNSDLALVAVPTPTSVDGCSADISAVHESIDWIDVPIFIRSTVPPGTTSDLIKLSGKAIAFCPEYIGESANHPWPDEHNCGFLIVGGSDSLFGLIRSAYRTVTQGDYIFVRTDPTTAELCKYMENSFLATKVAFVNQFHDIARNSSVDFEELRSLWLLDPRVGSSHTTVGDPRGFGGRCLPKDLRAIVSHMESRGGAPLLKAVLNYNEILQTTAGSHQPDGSFMPSQNFSNL